MNVPLESSIHLSVLIPIHDERESLPQLLEELRAVLEPTGRSYEILLVDDGSNDGSASWIADEERRDPHVRAVLLARRVGQSAALAAGLARVRGEVIVTLDADLQNDPADLPRVLAALENADVVSGVRQNRHDGWSRRWSSTVANSVRRAVIGDTLTDIGCSLKAYRHATLANLPLFVGVHRFLPALCQFRGARLVEIPVAHRARRHGVSKYGVSNRLWRGLVDLWGVRWLKSRLIDLPLREGDSR
jgi:dolichol-phosphate mannosyltransferase